MSDANDNVTVLDRGRKLADAVRSVKNAAADRDDVVVEMRDAERMRLELLANELAPVIAEVPEDVDIFDFAISSGLQPRFWVDSVSHVSMGRDRRTYRFLKDTRNGRVVLAESPEIKPVADQVTRYIAERIVERERMLEGGAPLSFRAAKPAQQLVQAAAEPVREETARTAVPSLEPAATVLVSQPGENVGWKALLWGLAIFLLGGIFGLSVVATQWVERITAGTAGP